MSVKTRGQLKGENSADFPDNTARLISPAALRGQMDDVADSMFLSEDLDTPGGPAAYLSGGMDPTSIIFEAGPALEAASISPTVPVIETQGYWTPGDGGGARYVRRASEPTLPGKFQSADGAWWEIVADQFNVKAFGAVGDGTTDDAGAIQDAIDRAIGLYNDGMGAQRVFLPPGQYAINVPLEVFSYTGPEFGYTTVTIEGSALGYAGNLATMLLPQFSDLPAIFIQKARTVHITGFGIQGLACVPTLPSWEDLLDDDSSPWWNTGGARDNAYSPHAGIAIDPFHASTPSGTNRYPGYESYYTSATGGGSSSVMIDHMLFQSFIVAVGVGISGTQLGECVTVANCVFTCNKVCVVSGQSQVRGLVVANNHAQGCQVYVDSTRYGQGNAPLGTITGGVLVYCKWVIMGGAAIDSATIRDLYVESTWSIGVWGWASASGHSLLIERCHFKLINAVSNPGSTAMHAIDAHLHCGPPVTFYGGYVGFNDNFVHRFSVRNSGPVLFDGNVMLDGTPQCAVETLVEFRSVRVRFEIQGVNYGISREYNDLLQNISLYKALAPPGCIINDSTTGRRWRSISGWRSVAIESGTVAFAVAGDGTATFTTTNHAMLRVGDELTTTTTWNGENPLPGVLTDQNYRRTLIGEVASVNSGTGAIGLIQVPKSLAAGSYTVYLEELPVIRPITVGTTTSASPTVTGVSTMLGAVTSGWVVGDHIQGTGIPTGARITAIAGTTFTLSHNATASGTVELYDARLVLEEGSATAAPASAVAWGKGTFLKNSNLTVKDASNMVLRGWICTASGAPGTWEPQYTSAVSPAT